MTTPPEEKKMGGEMTLTIEQFLDIWAFPFQRERMKADLEEMLQDEYLKGCDAGWYDASDRL